MLVSVMLYNLEHIGSVQQKQKRTYSTLPCGTPQITAEVVDWSSLIWTALVMSVMKDSIQDMTVSLIPNDV